MKNPDNRYTYYMTLYKTQNGKSIVTEYSTILICKGRSQFFIYREKDTFEGSVCFIYC